MYHSILVPLDGSTFGEHALPLALALARRGGASLQLAHVHVALAPTYGETTLNWYNETDAALRQSERTYLAKVVNRLTAVAPVSVTPALVEGPVAEALRERAAATHADLVVMTTHGRGPLARAWLGSVADELVRRLAIPVLAVRPAEVGVDLDKEPVIRHILIPLDGSELAEQIIEPAVALGSLLQADYTLLRVTRPQVMGNTDPAIMLGDGLDPYLFDQLGKLYDEEHAEAAKYLESVAAPLRARSLCVRTRVVAHEQPATAILEEVKAHRADMIAVATHGLSGLPRLFLGSVADKVLRGAGVPVLLHRPRTR
jgi:nucleotide-binding universal stress UspA family protein